MANAARVVLCKGYMSGRGQFNPCCSYISRVWLILFEADVSRTHTVAGDVALCN